MILEELLSVLNDSVPVHVTAAGTEDIIAVSDGRDSIPDELLDCTVTDVTVGNYILEIEVDILDVEMD